jgi:hypothetical protein
MKKFDIVVANPPFKGELHLKMFERAIDIVNQYMVFVHPSTWLTNQDGSKTQIHLKKKIEKYNKIFTLFNGNTVFNIGLYAPCVITFLDKTKIEGKTVVNSRIDNSTYEYSSIWNVNKFGNVSEFHSTRLKVLKFAKKDNLFKHINNKGMYYVCLARVRGNVSLNSEQKIFTEDFFTLIPRNFQPSQTKDKFYNFGFNTETEAWNFIKFLESNVARFCFSINKNGSSIRRKQLEVIPWLDFRRKWDDATLCSEFGISEKEMVFIKSIISDYYGCKNGSKK